LISIIAKPGSHPVFRTPDLVREKEKFLFWNLTITAGLLLAGTGFLKILIMEHMNNNSWSMIVP